MSRLANRTRSSLILDVNDWHPIDAGQLAGSGAAAVIAKATQGDRFVAATFAGHRQAAEACRIPFGAYHYIDVNATGDEAEHFLTVAKLRGGDLRPIIDAEDLSRGLPELAYRAARCAYVLERYGLAPIGYGSASTIVAMVQAQPGLARLPWWEAQYPGRFTAWSPRLARLRIRLRHGLSVVMWQWTDRFRVGHASYDASRLMVPLDRLLIP